MALHFPKLKRDAEESKTEKKIENLTNGYKGGEERAVRIQTASKRKKGKEFLIDSIKKKPNSDKTLILD